MERLKKAHIKYRSKIKINGREVDFVIGQYAIDIDGHEQDVKKNIMLKDSGYIPVHIRNDEVASIPIKLWQEQIFSTQKTQQ